MVFLFVAELGIVIGAITLFVIFGILAAISSWYKKVVQGQALVRTGIGKTQVSFEGMMVIPVLHRYEVMDTSLKRIEIQRLGKDGLICQDNIRADIKVVFFVRVNKNAEDVKKVAQTIGCARASSLETLVTLFDAKFSEALKTVGKQFEFVDLYNSRERFKQEILETIGRDLNGYILDDCAIDYLEQTPLEYLKENNILDAEGIKKITELTAQEKIKANKIRREEEKTITQQNVEAKEAILQLERQLAEKEEVQKREIASIKAREESTIATVQQEELLKSEQARINTEEQLAVAEENKLREVIVAEKSKERTEAIEEEKVQREQELEMTEREKVVALARIAKEKAIEEEKRNIQDVIKERVVVERAVVEEEEKIKDTKALAEADRSKAVAIKSAEQKAEEALVAQLKQAEADKLSAEWKAQKVLIDAQAAQDAALKDAEAKKILAEALAAEEAALGVSEAQVMEAKAQAKEIEGIAEAKVIAQIAEAEAKAIELKAEAEKKRGLFNAEVIAKQGVANAKVIEEKALAEAKGIAEKGTAEAQILKAQGLADAEITEQKGLAEAKSMQEKALAEAKGIEQKAEAMKQLDGVGKEHEEFKLRLEKEKAIELASINIQKSIADAQAQVIAEALKAANIDIVGGESMFFENIIGSVTKGKSLDRLVNNSEQLTALSQNLLNGEGGNAITKVKDFIGQFNLKTEDIKNLTLSALIIKMMNKSKDNNTKSELVSLLSTVKNLGIGGEMVKKWL